MPELPEVELFCGRERSRGAEERERAGEILSERSESKDLFTTGIVGMKNA